MSLMSRACRWVAAAASLIVLGCDAAAAAPPGRTSAAGDSCPPVRSPASADAIDRMVVRELAAKHAPGAALAIVRKGRIWKVRGYGYADLESCAPMTPDTRLGIGSISKQITAAVALTLVRDGLISLDDPIVKFLPEGAGAWDAIRIRHLLTHTSGLPNYTDFGSYDATQMVPTTPAELVSRFRGQPLLFPPGTQYMYENSDYVLLGVIIERASGQSYADFLRAAIFEPLGMRDTGVDQNRGAIVGQALGYQSDGEPAPFLDASTLFSAGSLYSTVEDMYRWDQALYTTNLLPQPLLDEMWTPYLNEYGYGWQITNAGGHRQISHPGLIDGFATAIARFPDDRVTVIVLSNMSSADAPGISDYLASLVFNS